MRCSTWRSPPTERRLLWRTPNQSSDIHVELHIDLLGLFTKRDVLYVAYWGNGCIQMVRLGARTVPAKVWLLWWITIWQLTSCASIYQINTKIQCWFHDYFTMEFTQWNQCNPQSIFDLRLSNLNWFKRFFPCVYHTKYNIHFKSKCKKYTKMCTTQFTQVSNCLILLLKFICYYRIPFLYQGIYKFFVARCGSVIQPTWEHLPSLSFGVLRIIFPNNFELVLSQS